MKFRIAVSTVCLLGLAVVLNVRGEEAAKTEAAEKAVDFEKIKCVLSGKKVNQEVTADYKGAKVYFCCPGCPIAFADSKEKFAAKANLQLVATKQAKQEKCPFSGGPAKAENTLKVAGVDVKFCCKNCQGRAAGAEGEEQINLVFNDKTFKKGFKVAKADKASTSVK